VLNLILCLDFIGCFGLKAVLRPKVIKFVIIVEIIEIMEPIKLADLTMKLKLIEQMSSQVRQFLPAVFFFMF